MKVTHPLLLASTSPRRQYLMSEAGFEFRTVAPPPDESYPEAMPAQMVPRFLAEKKAQAFKDKITNEVVIASDTVVILDQKILNKPEGKEQAVKMLSALSGRTHTVITAVCLLSKDKQDLFDDRTDVTFKRLTAEEIDYYIERCKPFDKAGSYGAQDWLGMVGIERINGSYFTVMGLPMHKLYKHLMMF